MSIDLNKIIWREVEEREYNDSYFRIPHRRTDTGNGLPIYELGTLPRELPIKRGAIIVPTSEYLKSIEYEPETFYFFDGENWGYVLKGDVWFDSEETIHAQEALDNGGTVVFDGIPDSIPANTDN